MRIESFTIEHYEDVMSLWHFSSGIGLSGADGKENIARFLERNAGTNFVALENNRVVGAVLCGHDGRRGYLYHLAVEKDLRLQGIGERLVRKVLEKLKLLGIEKSHVFVFDTNYDARQFWRRMGWQERDDISVFSRNT